MFDFYEQPYTLAGAAVIVLFGVLTFRSVLPERRHWRQWLLPLALAGGAFGLDGLVETDREQITAVIDAGVAAVGAKDIAGIEKIISSNYRDSVHSTKQRLLHESSQALSRNQVIKARKKGVMFSNLSESSATATVFVQMVFDKNSYVAENYKPSAQIKIDLTFEKRPGAGWLIRCAELRGIDTQSLSWRQAR